MYNKRYPCVYELTLIGRGKLMKHFKVSKRVNDISTFKKPNNDSELLLPLKSDDDV